MSTPPALPPLLPGLSPSRANDFQQCPLLFRFRVVDRLPEPPSPAQARGTLVHAVLEHLFELPAAERTPGAARELLPDRWDRLTAADQRYATVVDGPGARAAWFDEARVLLDRYFTLEDPARLEPRARELAVRTQLVDGPQLRGIVDRVDVAPDGAVRVVDYKTGRSPRPGFESSALFQMRFYAFLLWHAHGTLPRLLQLIYLGDGQVVRHEPTTAGLVTLEARVRHVWDGVQEAGRTGEWTPRPSRLCDWCAFQALCPAFGGEPPRVPDGAVERATGVSPD